MKHLLLLFVFLLSFFAKAQTNDSSKLIGIHPAVGKTITLDEKIKYKLFTNYNDSLFESAQVFKLSDSTYQLVIKPIDKPAIVKNITTKELDELYYTIDDKEKALTQGDDYARPEKEAETKETHHRQPNDYANRIWSDVITQLAIITTEVLLNIAFSR